MKAVFALVFILAIYSVQPVFAGTEECQEAINQYNTSMEDISSQLKMYTNCVSESQGHDDCSSEFMRLKSAQDDFESAVSSYGTDCQ